MVLKDIIRTDSSQMEMEQRRTSHVRRSQATVQTAVDNAVVKKLVVVGPRRETQSHFESMRRALDDVIKQMEEDRCQLLMTDRISWVAHGHKYREWIIVVCLALKFSVHEFERIRFRRLLQQHECVGACQLGLVLANIMESNMHSGVYCMFRLGHRANYWGK